MGYEQDHDAFLVEVNTLWNEMQAMNTEGLSPEQLSSIRHFVRENEQTRDALTNGRAPALEAYNASDPTMKARMEAELQRQRQAFVQAQNFLRQVLATKA
ncbi:hypothetical protein KA183_17935 [bacterium]|nr:hypothetical protein [bacterium]